MKVARLGPKRQLSHSSNFSKGKHQLVCCFGIGQCPAVEWGVVKRPHRPRACLCSVRVRRRLACRWERAVGLQWPSLPRRNPGPRAWRSWFIAIRGYNGTGPTSRYAKGTGQRQPRDGEVAYAGPCGSPLLLRLGPLRFGFGRHFTSSTPRSMKQVPVTPQDRARVAGGNNQARQNPDAKRIHCHH